MIQEDRGFWRSDILLRDTGGEEAGLCQEQMGCLWAEVRSKGRQGGQLALGRENRTQGSGSSSWAEDKGNH